MSQLQLDACFPRNRVSNAVNKRDGTFMVRLWAPATEEEGCSESLKLSIGSHAVEVIDGSCLLSFQARLQAGF